MNISINDKVRILSGTFINNIGIVKKVEEYKYFVEIDNSGLLLKFDLKELEKIEETAPATLESLAAEISKMPASKKEDTTIKIPQNLEELKSILEKELGKEYKLKIVSYLYISVEKLNPFTSEVMNTDSNIKIFFWITIQLEIFKPNDQGINIQLLKGNRNLIPIITRFIKEN